MTAALHESPPKSVVTALMAFFLLVSVTVSAQVRLSGTVKDAVGNGIPGITVSVKNTSFSTATDINGAYTL
ncbi:MAG TPA: carboxypeptidase-like regulatory domain-containing protein, partial [Flavihumibacter sp.]|nr:carboxypeptidase-like regulatory domain-containing protein [Flavihumibacter sp.]